MLYHLHNSDRFANEDIDESISASGLPVSDVHIIVQALRNDITPDVVEHFAAVQAGLADEISKLLSTLSKRMQEWRFSEEV